MSNCLSCVGCKFLYGRQEGYSSYTVTDIIVVCALDRNPSLLNDAAREPQEGEWLNQSPDTDNFFATKNGRCDRYSPTPAGYFSLWPHEDDPSEKTADQEAIDAIRAHIEIWWNQL